MRSFFRLVLSALILLVVALVSALTAMRIAIHGREVTVPDFSGKTPTEARRIAEQDGLPIELDRQYYSSTVPEGRIVSQAPLAGTKVRRGWQVRVAESLGPQRVQIPDVVAESERAAEINIRRRGLDISSVAQIAAPGMPDDRVIAQDPSANASEISAPTIGLLVSEGPLPQSFVMPSFVGKPLGAATSVLRDAGFEIGKVSLSTPLVTTMPATAAPPVTPSPTVAVSSATPASVIVSQDPSQGQKVPQGTSVNFSVR
ncbi:MAG: PASTA domain-containing protein [Terriglobales bacterium]